MNEEEYITEITYRRFMVFSFGNYEISIVARENEDFSLNISLKDENIDYYRLNYSPPNKGYIDDINYKVLQSIELRGYQISLLKKDDKLSLNILRN